MEDAERIKAINKVLTAYFRVNKDQDSVPVKALMPDFIKAGIFVADEKNGLPIRKILRALDKENGLKKIPRVHAERKAKDVYWYFVRKDATFVSEATNDTGISKKKKAKVAVANSDKNYLTDLCDELFQLEASRQHRFDFLLGDMHKDGKTQSTLPVDAYYEDRNLVIEIMESRDIDPIIIREKPSRKTIEAVKRSKQIKVYQERKRNGLVAKEIDLVLVKTKDFECNEEKHLVREKENDLSVLKGLLAEYLAK